MSGVLIATRDQNFEGVLGRMVKATKARTKSKIRGYDQGGQISSDSLGKSIMQGAQMAMGAYNMYSQAKAAQATAVKGTPASTPPPSPPPNAPQGAVGGDMPMAARGGRIKRVAGKPIGKDDGLIAAQKGEYVVRKAAVNKLGTKALNSINRGKLPARKAR
jgi:hypothetical protein